MVKFKIKNAAVNLLFPPTCIVCGKRINVISDLSGIHCVCFECRALYESKFNEVCSVCNKSVSSCTCGVKIGNREIYPLAKCFFYKPQDESGAGNRIIYAIKHIDDKRIASMLARELSGSVLEMMKNEGIDPSECIFTFVPRRRVAIRKNGFDQGKRLARLTAKFCCGRKGFYPLLSRTRGKEQKKLAAKKREKNSEAGLTLARFAKGKVNGKTVCVVDDVVTSGATMRASEKLLLAGGAKRVVFACVARTKSDK